MATLITAPCRKIRLMHITHDLAIGGLQQVVKNICSTIDRDRFDVSVLCLRARGELAPVIENLGVKVMMIHQIRRTDYFTFLKVAKVLRREKIDVIHTHNTQPFVDGTLGALMAGVKTIIHTDHARNFPDKKRYMFAEWCMSHFASQIVGVSEHTSKNLTKYEKIPLTKIATIPNGIDGSIYEIHIDREAKREELGLPAEGPIIGVAARLIEGKGISHLLQALPSVVKIFPALSLLVIGDGPYAQHLISECDALNLNRHVTFVGSRLDMPELLKLMDIFVLPSLSEGLPMVLIEAMAAKCPIIATRVGGVPKALEFGRNGYLVPVRDAEALGRAIIRLLSDEKLRSQYADNALRAFRNRYTAEKMTAEYSRLYIRDNHSTFSGFDLVQIRDNRYQQNNITE